jgi:hypothetical protein
LSAGILIVNIAVSRLLSVSPWPVSSSLAAAIAFGVFFGAG